MSIRPQSWLEDVFRSPQAIVVLRRLAREPNKYWTGRELAEVLGMAPSSAKLVLGWLRDFGLLDFRRAGASYLFRLRDDVAFTKQLRRVFEIEAATFPTFLDRVASVLPKGASCILFGSTSRGDNTRASDVDLLVVAPTDDLAEQAASTVRAEGRRLGPMTLDVIALTHAQFGSRRFASLARSVRAEGRVIAGPPVKGVSR